MIFHNQEHDLIKPEMPSQTSYGKNTNQQELQTIFTFEKSLLITCTYLLIPQLCNVVTLCNYVTTLTCLLLASMRVKFTPMFMWKNKTLHLSSKEHPTVCYFTTEWKMGKV